MAITLPSSQKTIQKILIANRGEIACRVIRTCRRLGIATVAVFSEAYHTIRIITLTSLIRDRDALFVQMADEAVLLGPPPASESYLCADKIVDAALRTGADGYGFLSENAEFARLCKKRGVIFIGPEPESITAIGDKIGAKNLLSSKAPSVPLIPGYNGDDQSVEKLTNEAIRIGFPVLIKASSGGGGKGMRVVREKSRLKDEIEMAQGEAQRSFGDSKLLIEKYFENVKHIEIQIMGDQHGNVFHCFERECSVQRRHQKVIEETPSPALDNIMRKQMTDAAVTIGKIIRYHGAGTVEFIADTKERKFYFLEVNTRLQVEHPITEAITGLDLVELQIHVANGLSLQETAIQNVRMRGYAIESRLYAEDPDNQFFPSIGQIQYWKQSSTPSIRYDTGAETGAKISVFYDPLISKITVWSPISRLDAIRQMEFALKQTICLGITTNRSFLVKSLNWPAFLDGSYTTRMVDDMILAFQLKKDNVKFDSGIGFNYSRLLNSDYGLQIVIPPGLVPPSIGRDKQLPDTMIQRSSKESIQSSFFISRLEEMSIAATLWQIFVRDQTKSLFRYAPTGYQLNRWRGSMDAYQVVLPTSLNDVDGKVELEYVIDAKRKETHVWMRRIRRKLVETPKSRDKKEPKQIYKEIVGDWIVTQIIGVEGWKPSSNAPFPTRGIFKCILGTQQRAYAIASTFPRTVEQISSVNDQQFETNSMLYIQVPELEKQFTLKRISLRAGSNSNQDDADSAYVSTMPCRILKVLVKNESNVKVGDVLLTMESMKMETRVHAKHDGVVRFQVKEGQLIEAGIPMLTIDSE